VRGAWQASSCWTRRASGESGGSRVCSGTRRCWVAALGGEQSPARLLRATAAGSTAGHAAAAMPRRPWLGARAKLQWGIARCCTQGRSKTQCRRCGAIEWAGAGRAACFSSRGLSLLRAARWQIGSGCGAVRTWRAGNWIGSASWVRAASWMPAWECAVERIVAAGGLAVHMHSGRAAGVDGGLRLRRRRRGSGAATGAAQPAYLTVAANKRWSSGRVVREWRRQEARLEQC
jgi:hypothetical protein